MRLQYKCYNVTFRIAYNNFPSQRLSVYTHDYSFLTRVIFVLSECFITNWLNNNSNKLFGGYFYSSYVTDFLCNN